MKKPVVETEVLVWYESKVTKLQNLLNQRRISTFKGQYHKMDFFYRSKHFKQYFL
jgi:hypothetical protein